MQLEYTMVMPTSRQDEWREMCWALDVARARGDAAPFPAFDADPRRFGGVRVVHDPRRSGVLITVPDTAPANATLDEINAMNANLFGPDKGKGKSERAIEQANNEGNDIGDGNGKSKYQRKDGGEGIDRWSAGRWRARGNGSSMSMNMISITPDPDGAMANVARH